LSEHRPFRGAAPDLILSANDPPPVAVSNQGGQSPFLLIGDHAGRAVPEGLAALGLAPEAFDLHIAWDIGVAGLGRRLADGLDACFISQAYSRLVIDCNRRLKDPSSIAVTSDRIEIPGNRALPLEAALARRREIYDPYHAAIATELDRRAADARPTALVSLHSFTPVFQGIERTWRFGVLHRNDSRLSARVLALLKTEVGAAVGDNQPYALDEKDNTVPLHADPRGLDYLELEIRQDLIATDEGQAEVAAIINRILMDALA
jgi:predicted N-formylglutamate amidohydrolase